MDKEASFSIISEHAEKYSQILGIRNHKRLNHDHFTPDKSFRFTMRTMCPKFINSLNEDPRVKNIYYNSSFTPPGGSFDSISLRYKVYVEYY